MKKVLFLCTGNSCRSQMAEGFARALRSDALEAYSAGVAPNAIDPRAIRAMRELGIDISRRRSKHVDELRDISFDWIVTVCDDAREACPIFPGEGKVMHVAFDDPPRLARDSKSDDQAMAHYRRVRDEIKSFVERFEFT